MAANDSTAGAAATHAGLREQRFSVCSGRLRPPSIEAGHVAGLGRSALRSGSAARFCPGLPERIGDGDRGAAGGKARRSAAHPGDREAQIPDRQAAADAVRPLLGAADPAASNNSSCGSRSWKPAKPKRSAKAAAEDRPLPIREGARPKRKPLPDHLPRAGDRARTGA